MTTTPLRFAAKINLRVLPEWTAPDSRFQYIDIGSVDSDGNIRRPAEMIAFAEAPSRARRLAPPGSTIVSTVRTYLRAIAYVDADLARNAVFSTGFAVLEPAPWLNDRFFHYACRSERFVEEVVARSVGVSYPAIAPTDLGSLEIPSPSLAVQRRIADFLDDQVARIDEVIRLRQRQVEALELLLIERSRVLTTGSDSADTKATGVEWMPMVASGWTIPKVSHVFDTGSGTTPASDHPEYFDGSVPWVNTGEVRDGFIHQTAKSITTAALREYPTLKVYDSGSLVVAMYGQGATKGRVGIMTIPAAVNQACCVLAARGEVPSMWAYFWFRAFKAEIVQLAVGSGQPNLNQELIRALRLPVPPPRAMEERMRSLESLKRMTDQAIVEMRTQIDLLHERKRSLITAAVTGEFDVSTASGRGVA